MKELRFPRDLKLGVSACAVQTEGGNVKNSWYDWYKKGYVKDGSSPAAACGFYEEYRRDIDLAAVAGIKYMRIGVEWSRIEPAKGVFNNGVLMHYRQILEYALESGITPIITLHAFSDPLWFSAIGGFENDGCRDIFLHYVRKAAETFGDLASGFITFDEPNLYALNGYFYGTYPPGKQSYKTYRKVLTNLAACHCAAYDAIHETRRAMGYEDTSVSCSVYTEYYEAEDAKSFYQKKAVKKLEAFTYLSFAKAVLAGEFERPLNRIKDISGCHADFIAMDYLTGYTVTGFEKGSVPAGVPVSDDGKAVRPEGIAACAGKLHELRDLPVYITANGVCDRSDNFRIRYIYEHLSALLETALPVERYYYRSLTDSFEFLDGETAPYGLISVDFGTGDRQMRRSGRFYSEAASKGGITEEMCLRYTGQYYRDNEGNALEGIDEFYFDREKFLKSDTGKNVVTDVESFVKDPASYSEEETREENGLSVSCGFPEEEIADAAVEEVAEISEGPGQEDDLSDCAEETVPDAGAEPVAEETPADPFKELDRILGR